MAGELTLGNIKPVGADNVVVEAKYVKGGFVVVSSTDERNGLKGDSGENIVTGSLCYCTADSTFYQYNGSSWQSANLGGGGGGGGSLDVGDKSSTLLYLIGATAQDNTATTGTYNKLFLNTDGYLNSTGFNATSDRRLKENIKEFIPQKSILDLPIVEYDFIDTKRHDIGCLAQDLQEICPEIVSEDEKGFLSIEESKIVYLLLDEVKKLRAEVDQLKALNNGGNN